MITRLLVANRGEVARRIFRTCRDLGIETVAVASDADAALPHATEADLTVRLPGNSPADTYLRVDAIVTAALTAGADAVHPGYGFLSESAELARAVLAAGLTWVGPPPAAIAAMGSKVDAKQLMRAAGVPILAQLEPADLSQSDLPVLVKASAGGGGRGMRVVTDLTELAAALAAAETEASAAFGDGTVFCEPFVRAGRHLEVQVLADQHGTVWALPERDCSIQRRHQKVIEESPGPTVDADLRERLTQAALSATRAVDYVGAGTVEFLAGPDGQFFFLEMNTRLQVEHPVTECVTGLDLVAWQLRIAEGDALPDQPPAPRGHAVEARLYAEDPMAGWLPQSGTLHRFQVDADARFTVTAQPAGVRVDSTVEDGSTVGPHYDPMLAKVVAWAPTRAAAIRRLATALARARIHGLVTNRDLLVRTLRHPAFQGGTADTDFFTTHGVPGAPLADEATVDRAAAAATVAGALRARPVLADVPSAWRNLPGARQHRAFLIADRQVQVAYHRGRPGLVVVEPPGIVVVSASADAVVLEVDGVRHRLTVTFYPDLVCVDGVDGTVALRPVPRFGEATTASEPGGLVAPMPGSVAKLHVAPGDHVVVGQPLVTLEAMKMLHPVTATSAGVVASLLIEVGSQVDSGTLLAVVTTDDGS